MNITLHTTTRRRLLTSSLGNALAIAFLPAAMLVQGAGAGKKKKVKARGTVADRTQSQREACETIGGGQLAVLDGPHGSNTTECKGGAQDGWTCYNTKKDTTCHQGLTRPSSPLNDATAPATGGNEQPHDGGKPAGGGAHVDPGPAEDPGGQASGPIVLFATRNVSVNAVDESVNNRRKGKRRNQRHSKSRQR